MRRVEQHRIERDAPATDWRPVCQPKTADGATPVITIRQLLTHTAGLTYVFLEPADGAYHRLGVSNGFDLPGPRLHENIRRIGEVPLSYEPGADWGYSMGMDLFVTVVTTVEGTPRPEVVTRL